MRSIIVSTLYMIVVMVLTMTLLNTVLVNQNMLKLGITKVITNK